MIKQGNVSTLFDVGVIKQENASTLFDVGVIKQGNASTLFDVGVIKQGSASTSFDDGVIKQENASNSLVTAFSPDSVDPIGFSVPVIGRLAIQSVHFQQTIGQNSWSQPKVDRNA